MRLSIQLRESISQDQERTEALKCQMQELETEIQNVDAKIHHAEVTLKDMRQLQEQISTKTAERSTLFKEQQKQYAALAEENEGWSNIMFVSPLWSPCVVLMLVTSAFYAALYAGY